jgi:hypothetical protein
MSRAARSARRIALDAGSMSDEQLLEAFGQLRLGRLLAGPLSFAAGTVVVVAHGVLLLVSNWRLVLLELLPAVWLAAVLWDWRFHVLQGHEPVLLGGWVAVVVAVAVVSATLASYWCNVAFAYAAIGGEPRPGAALRATARHWRVLVGVAVGVGLTHAWVTQRAAARGGVGLYAVALGLVALVDLYLYSALPAQVMGLDRREGVRNVVTRVVTTGAIGVLVALPGLVLAILAHLLLGLPVLRLVGLAVLVVAVVIQIAAVSSGRAVRLSAAVLAAGGRGAAPSTPGAEGTSAA